MAGEPVRWARLEPGSRDRELAPGLEARLHDPLWLLGRQWQFGEFAASDGGSAIVADVSATLAPLTAVRRGRTGTAAQPYAVSAVPLETLVEAENVQTAPTLRMRARAGQHFERLLVAGRVGQYAAAYRAAYPLAAAADGSDTPDANSRRFAALISGRAVDGARLAVDLRKALAQPAPALPPAPVIAAADVTAVRSAAQVWLAWADALVFAPPAAPPGSAPGTPPGSAPAGWLNERLEYTFATSSPDGLTLEADEYTDGHLDWHTFTAAGTVAAAPTGRTTLGPLTMVPTAVNYPGMPASRLWEFEDGQVNFGALEAGPDDLGRMLLAGFALVYGANWLLLPLEVPQGTIVRITRLDVRDTFGSTTSVGPTAPGGEWTMFGLSRPNRTSEAALLAAPALAASVAGRDIEDVLLLRDEAANLAWAIERAIEGADGRPADLAQAAHEAVAPAPPADRPSETLSYRLRSDPPPYWFPLLPQRAQPADPSMTFQLGLLPRDGAATGPRPRGRLLAPLAGSPRVSVREDEVPREGARVTRAYQLARWIDGSTFLWLGRRKGVGHGEGSSGLRFDVTDE